MNTTNIQSLAAAGALLFFASQIRAVASTEGSTAPTDTNTPTERVRMALGSHTNFFRILDKNPIYLPSSGRIDMPFDMGREIADQFDLVARLAEAAIDSSFRLRHREGERFLFTNKNREDCDITVLSSLTETNAFSTTWVVEGDRFFGKFYAIIHVRSGPDQDGKVIYDMDLFAYPVSSTWRFIVRNIGVVRRYFRDRILAMIGITTRTYETMAHDPDKIMDAMRRRQGPEDDPRFTQEEIDRVRSLTDRFRPKTAPPAPSDAAPPPAIPATSP